MRPQPLGPDSLMWEYFGDWRGLLCTLWAGSMQNMHPQLGAGVEEHSRFFEERWQRLFRSVYPINGCVYDGERAETTARQVRDYHRTVHGVDAQGRRYSALDPDTFFWAHATFLMLPVLICEHFGRPLTAEQKERLYAEAVQWWRLYGLSMRPVPADWTAFERYWEDTCRTVLEDNAATRAVLDLQGLPKPPALPWLPDPLWALAWGGLRHGAVWVTVGLYPPAVRERLGFRWHAHDELAFRAFGRAVGTGWRLVPRPLRLHPRARTAYARERGRRPVDAPLVETPARNLPPRSERGRATHYCPTA